MTPEALAALHARAGGDRPWSAAEFADLLAAPGAVLAGDGRAFALGRVAADEAEVLMVATDPDHRRRGLASAALAALEAEAALGGAARAVLEVAEDNHAARGLYASRGYAPVGCRSGYYVRPGAPACSALILARPLR